MIEDETDSLSRPQRRLLRRMYNGRTVPIDADGKQFLTYKDAARHLLSLQIEEREKVYDEMRIVAKTIETPAKE